MSVAPHRPAIVRHEMNSTEEAVCVTWPAKESVRPSDDELAKLGSELELYLGPVVFASVIYTEGEE